MEVADAVSWAVRSCIGTTHFSLVMGLLCFFESFFF